MSHLLSKFDPRIDQSGNDIRDDRHDDDDESKEDRKPHDKRVITVSYTVGELGTDTWYRK